MNIVHQNDLYHDAALRRELALNLYEGAERMIGVNAEKYLIPHPFETPAQYTIRLRRSAYRNFAAPIVDVFSSSVSQLRPPRVLPPQLEPILADIDGSGTDADAFFYNIVRLACAGGVRFVLVDMQHNKGKTLAEDKAGGRRIYPYFVSIDPDDVYDWFVDDEGLAWVTLHRTEIPNAQPFEDVIPEEVITLWTREKWYRYRGIRNAGDRAAFVTDFTVEADGDHNLGEVPLIPFQFEPSSPMTGNAVTDDVMELILQVFRHDSEYSKAVFDTAVPLLTLGGVDALAQKNFVRASSNVLFTTEPNGISAQYIEPSGMAFQAHKDILDSTINSIREIALRQVRPQSAVGQSAEAKMLDKLQLDSQMAMFARRCAGAEKACWLLAAKWLGLDADSLVDKIDTEYNENYSVDNIERTLDRDFLLRMYSDKTMSRQTVLEMLKEIGVLPPTFDTEEETARLSRETVGEPGPIGQFSNLSI